MPFDWNAPADEADREGGDDRSVTGASCGAWDNGECVGTPLCPPRCPRFFDRQGRPLIVRRYADDDFAELVEMYDRIDSRSFGLPPKTRPAIEDWVGDLTTRGWNLVVRDEWALVGHLAVIPAKSAEPEFVVFVHDDHQRRGIGTELVKQAIAHAATDEYDALTLLVHEGNTAAVNVYTNIGFEVIDRDLSELEMRLGLDSPVATEVRKPPASR